MGQPQMIPMQPQMMGMGQPTMMNMNANAQVNMGMPQQPMQPQSTGMMMNVVMPGMVGPNCECVLVKEAHKLNDFIDASRHGPVCTRTTFPNEETRSMWYHHRHC
jgi:hypothetical protein